jgi:hypothetical protein
LVFLLVLINTVPIQLIFLTGPSDTVRSFTKYISNLPHSRYDCYISRINFLLTCEWQFCLEYPKYGPVFSKYKRRENDPELCNSFFVLINGRFK